MGVAARLLAMEDGTQSEFGLQASEHRLYVGERDVGTPELLWGPGGFVAAQAIHARIAHLGTGERLFGPGQRIEFLARALGLILDAVVLADARHFCLSRPMRSVILTRRFSPRGFARPSQSLASPCSKRWVRRATMATSFCSRPGEWQYRRTSCASALSTLCKRMRCPPAALISTA